MTKKQLVLIGGGHAHMMLLAHIENFVARGTEVTVIQPSPCHYYSGMGAGMLGNTYGIDDIRFQTQKVVEKQGGSFVLDRVIRIDPHNKEVICRQNNRKINYDVLSCNAGSYVPDNLFSDCRSNDIYPVKPIEGLARAREQILCRGKAHPLRVVIVGGGPSAMELAGNIHQLANSEQLAEVAITIIAGHAVLPHAPRRVRLLVERSLRRRGVNILTSSRVKKIEEGLLKLTSGKTIPADMIFAAIGVRPSNIFIESGLPIGPDGGLRVNKYLQSIAHKSIFGGGDCIYFAACPLDKVGVYAVRQNPVLLHNVMAALVEKPLKEFYPRGTYLLIYNLGDGYGVLQKWSLTLGGRLPFLLKDYIDRKFMRTYQALEQ